MYSYLKMCIPEAANEALGEKGVNKLGKQYFGMLKQKKAKLETITFEMAKYKGQ